MGIESGGSKSSAGGGGGNSSSLWGYAGYATKLGTLLADSLAEPNTYDWSNNTAKYDQRKVRKYKALMKQYEDIAGVANDATASQYGEMAPYGGEISKLGKSVINSADEEYIGTDVPKTDWASGLMNAFSPERSLKQADWGVRNTDNKIYWLGAINPFGVGMQFSRDLGDAYSKMDIAKRQMESSKFTSPQVQSPLANYGTAKKGLYAMKSVPVEVEGNELKLRKEANGQYVKVQKYVGPKHEQGGIDTRVNDGDIIIPTDKVKDVELLLATGQHNKIEGIVNTLPTKTMKAQDGLNVFGWQNWVGDYTSATKPDPNSVKVGLYFKKPFNEYQPKTIVEATKGITQYVPKTNVTTPTAVQIPNVNKQNESELNSLANLYKPFPPEAEINNPFSPKEDNPLSSNQKSQNVYVAPTQEEMSGVSRDNEDTSIWGNVKKGWNDMDSFERGNTILSGAEGAYALGSLIKEWFRKPSDEVQPIIPQRPTQVKNVKLNQDVSPFIAAGEQNIMKQAGSARKSMTEQGVNPLYANAATASPAMNANLELRSKAAEMSNQISAQEANINANINMANAQQINAWKKDVASLRYEYDKLNAQIKLAENEEISKAKSSLWQMLFNTGANYLSNDLYYTAYKDAKERGNISGMAGNLYVNKNQYNQGANI